jgi:phenylpyruvate tautomerase PptA (4-oxalocrotonate tautomerase family)
MPTYTCTTAQGRLDAAAKALIARAITNAHAEITGAPHHFAQVIFAPVAQGDHFAGGDLLGHDHIFVYGRIRAGRSAIDRKALVRRIIRDVAEAGGLDAFSVWVYFLELPVAAMAELASSCRSQVMRRVGPAVWILPRETGCAASGAERSKCD